jgi:hypothetical protein
VTLDPALNDQDKIECSLNTARLDGVGDFEAISYAWGQPGRITLNFIDSKEHRVTKNLYHALRDLPSVESDKTKRILWVDAL